jgi:tetratricopeptide (TPR) repeat protein
VKALNFNTRALKIFEELGNKYGIGNSLIDLGIILKNKKEYDKSLRSFFHALELKDEIGDKHGMRTTLLHIGWAYYTIGDYNKALDYYNRELIIDEELGDKHAIQNDFTNMGLVYLQQEDYNNAVVNLEKSATMQIELDSTITLETLSHLFLSKKILGKEYNVKEIHTLIKEQEEIDDYINFALFKLLEDISYLKTAYKQIQEKADNLEPNVSAKFLSYPIPKAIVEEWEEVK